MSANTPDEMSELRRTSAARSQADQEPDGRLRSLLMGVGAVVLIGAVVAGVIIFQGGGGGTVGPVRHPPRVTATSHGIAVGPASAPVHVVVHEDFGSAACARFEMGSRDYLRTDAAAGRVRVEYRPAAFGGPGSVRALHTFAAVLDTAGPTAAFRFHDLLFEREATEGQPPAGDELVSLARKAGAREPAVRAAATSGTQGAWVAAADAAARHDGVRDVPTVLLDGRVLHGSIDQLVDHLETRIAQED
jgi:protein-disulfide isomerase